MTAEPLPGLVTAEPSLLVRSAVLPRVLYNSDIVRLSAIGLLGGYLRFYHISYLSLWSDEAFSRFYYQTGLHFMWTEGLHSESSPPLYYMAIGAWIHLFGSSEAALRSLSAVASTFAIFLVYRLGVELFDRKHAILAAALFALSATQIYYAQEARCYALLLIPILSMLIASARYVRGSDRIASLAIYTLAASVGIYTHTTMFFVVAACGLAVFVCILAEGRELWNRRVIGWIGSHLCVGILALPALIGMIDPIQRRQLTWIPPVSLRQIGAVFSNTVAGTLTPGRFPGGMLAIALVVVLAISIWRHRSSRRTLLVAVAIPATYTALIILVSLTVQPILLSRILCWLVIPLCLIEAQALLAHGWLRPIAMGIILGTAAVGLYYQLSINPGATEPWREAVQYAATALRQADLVVLAPGTDPSPLGYYAPKLRHVMMLSSDTLAPSQLGIMPRLLDVSGVPLAQVEDRINDPSSRTVLIAGASDEAIVAGLSRVVRPPDERADFRCRGGDNEPTSYPCSVAVLVWGPLLEPPDVPRARLLGR
jgi:mannosyltransferase